MMIPADFSCRVLGGVGTSIVAMPRVRKDFMAAFDLLTTNTKQPATEVTEFHRDKKKPFVVYT
jgi:hypothetical protein